VGHPVVLNVLCEDFFKNFILFIFGAIFCPRLTWKSCKHSRPKSRAVHRFATLNDIPIHGNYNETNPCQETPPPTRKSDVSGSFLVSETKRAKYIQWYGDILDKFRESNEIWRLTSSTDVQMISLFFCYVTQSRLVVSYRSFGTSEQYHFLRSSSPRIFSVSLALLATNLRCVTSQKNEDLKPEKSLPYMQALDSRYYYEKVDSYPRIQAWFKRYAICLSLLQSCIPNGFFSLQCIIENITNCYHSSSFYISRASHQL